MTSEKKPRKSLPIAMVRDFIALTSLLSAMTSYSSLLMYLIRTKESLPSATTREFIALKSNTRATIGQKITRTSDFFALRSD